MSWAEALLLLITYCTSGANSKLSLQEQNQCRNDKLECVKKVTRQDGELQNPVAKAEREVYLVNGCLSDSKFVPVALPKPVAPSPVPQAQVKPRTAPLPVHPAEVSPSPVPKK